MADLLLDSDVLIWYLRGKPEAVALVRDLAGEARLGLSVISRAEILQGMRPAEEEATIRLLDALETLPIGRREADLAALSIRRQRALGKTLQLPDMLIAATSILASIPLYTCNVRHYPLTELEVRAVAI